MKCRICKDETSFFDCEKILRDREIDFFYCKKCNSISTEQPYWLDLAYSDAIASIDTGIMLRNDLMQKWTTQVAYHLYGKDVNILDFAGGYGILTRQLRDNGLNAFWQDKYCDCLVAKGFEIDNNSNVNINLVTAYEVMEHLVDPIETLSEILSITDNLLFTTSIIPKELPKPTDWWYYSLESGQHVQFYSVETLEWIADYFKLNLYTNGIDRHLLSKREFPKSDIKKYFLKSRERYYKNAIKQLSSKTITDMNNLKSL